MPYAQPMASYRDSLNTEYILGFEINYVFVPICRRESHAPSWTARSRCGDHVDAASSVLVALVTCVELGSGELKHPTFRSR